MHCNYHCFLFGCPENPEPPGRRFMRVLVFVAFASCAVAYGLVNQ